MVEINLIRDMNNKVNFLALLISFLITIIFLIIGSFIFGLLLNNQIIDFKTYIGFSSIFGIFFGGLALGFIGCENYNDANANSLSYFLVILNIVLGIIGYLIFTIFGITSSFNSLGESSVNSPYSGVFNSVLGKYIVFLIFILSLSVLSILAGSYLGVFLKEKL